MSVTTTKKDSLRGALNRAEANDIPDAFFRFGFGEFLAMLFNNSAQVSAANASDLATAITLVNALKTSFNSLQGFATEKAVTVTTNAATLAAAASVVFNVVATTGTTTGVKKLVPASRVPQTGEVSWNGTTGLIFATVDAVTACDVAYAKADASQKVSLLLTDYPPG